MEKLSRHRLPRKEAWVSLLVQAAVAWRCPGLKMVQNRTETQFRYALPPSGPVEIQRILERLGSNFEAHDGDGFFSFALQVLMGDDDYSFLFYPMPPTCPQDGFHHGPYFGESSREEWRARRYSSSREMVLTVFHAPVEARGPFRFKTVREHQIPLYWELNRHASYAPIPIYLDGRRADGRFFPDRGYTGGVDLVDVRGLSGLEFSPPNLVLPKSFASCTQALAVLGVAPSSPVSAQRSKIHWVRSGVLVEEAWLQRATLLLETRILINAEGLATDLSGFRLVDCVEKRAREVEALKALAGELKESQKVLDEKKNEALDLVETPPPDFLEDSDAIYGKLVPAPMIVVGTLTLMVLTPLVFPSGPLLGLGAVTAGAGLIGGGFWAKPEGRKWRRLAPLRKVEERFETLARDLESLKSGLLEAAAALETR